MHANVKPDSTVDTLWVLHETRQLHCGHFSALALRPHVTITCWKSLSNRYDYEVLFKWFVLPVAGLILKCWSLYKFVVYFQQGHCPTSNKSVACPRQDSMNPLRAHAVLSGPCNIYLTYPGKAPYMFVHFTCVLRSYKRLWVRKSTCTCMHNLLVQVSILCYWKLIMSLYSFLSDLISHLKEVTVKK